MKLQIASDLHLDMRRNYLLPKLDSDVIILAGDISLGYRGLKYAVSLSHFHKKEVIYVAGNHEFYRQDYHELIQSMREYAEGYEHVHFLERDEIVIDGTRFLGTTLWTDYLGDKSEHQEINQAIVGASLNDHRLIRNGDRSFSVDDAYEEHLISKKWLKEKLGEKFKGKTVVVTHHAPSQDCQHPDYDYSPISTGFQSSLDELVELADVWVFGHTHASLDIRMGKCRLISNQLGYPHEMMPVAFNPDLVVEL